MMERLREKGVGFSEEKPPEATASDPGPVTDRPSGPKIEMRRPPRGDEQVESRQVPLPEPTQAFERTPVMKEAPKKRPQSEESVPYLPPPAREPDLEPTNKSVPELEPTPAPVCICRHQTREVRALGAPDAAEAKLTMLAERGPRI